MIGAVAISLWIKVGIKAGAGAIWQTAETGQKHSVFTGNDKKTNPRLTEVSRSSRMNPHSWDRNAAILSLIFLL